MATRTHTRRLLSHSRSRSHAYCPYGRNCFEGKRDEEPLTSLCAGAGARKRKHPIATAEPPRTGNDSDLTALALAMTRTMGGN